MHDLNRSEDNTKTSTPRQRVGVVRAGWLPTQQANGVQTIEMCRAFARIGLDVDLYYIPARNTPNEVRSRLGLEDTVDLVPLPRAVLPLRKRFVLRHAVDVPTFVHAWAWAGFAARIARRNSPSFCFVREPALAYWTSRLNVPTILEVHTLPVGIMARIFRAVAARRNVVGIVAVTGLLAADLEDAHLARPDKLCVLHDGVDCEAFAPVLAPVAARAQLGLTGTTPLVVYAGSGYSDKGLDVFADAARCLPQYRFAAIGPTAAHVNALRARPGNLVFIPHVPHRDIPQYLAAADVLVLPTRRDRHTARYASPMKLFEYMATGRPIVATNLPSFREVLTHGANAWLVDPDSPSALAAGVREVVDDEELRATLGSNARRDAQHYGWEARAARIADLVARQSDRK